MGKKSRREPVGPPGRTESRHTQLDSILRTRHNLLCQEFDNESDCLAHYRDIGLKFMEFYAEFGYDELTAKLRDALPDICVTDDTAKIENGLSYDPKTLVRLVAKRHHSSGLSIIHRTRKNTPSFLRGLMQLYVESEGSAEKAVEYVQTQNSDCPCAIVIFDGQLFALPSHLLQGNADFYARIIKSFVRKADPLMCVICGLPLMVFLPEGVAMETFVVAKCQHAFHPKCAHQHFANSPTPQNCPKCAGPLPFEWSMFRKSADAMLDELERDVKEAMRMDGLGEPLSE